MFYDQIFMYCLVLSGGNSLYVIGKAYQGDTISSCQGKDVGETVELQATST